MPDAGHDLMIYSPTKACTVYGDVGGRGGHLIVVCNDPVMYKGDFGEWEAILTVNITSWHNTKNDDSTCILDKGDHSFIKHKSFVYYRYAVPTRSIPFSEKIENGELVPMEILSPLVFQRILNGFEISPYTPINALRFYRRFIKV